MIYLSKESIEIPRKKIHRSSQKKIGKSKKKKLAKNLAKKKIGKKKLANPKKIKKLAKKLACLNQQKTLADLKKKKAQ